MPRTRGDVGRDAKVEEILDAAERRLIAGGYAEMSVAAIARELAVAQNSIYWYFRSKDELFVAVLRRLLERLAATKPPRREGLFRKLVWGADYLAEFAPLRGTMRERSEHSRVVAEFERELDALLHGLLSFALEPHLAPEEVDVAARALMATVEGTFAAGLSKRERDRVLKFTLERFAGPGSS